jgi:hypothetical protein
VRRGEWLEGRMNVRTILRSDLFRSLVGGFLLGAATLVVLQPAEQSEALKERIVAAAQI